MAEGSANDNVGKYVDANENGIRQLLECKPKGLDDQMAGTSSANRQPYDLDKGCKWIWGNRYAIEYSIDYV